MNSKDARSSYRASCAKVSTSSARPQTTLTATPSMLTGRSPSRAISQTLLSDTSSASTVTGAMVAATNQSAVCVSVATRSARLVMPPSNARNTKNASWNEKNSRPPAHETMV